jgi:hypothetical protein
MTTKDTDTIREFMAGAQYFDCTALKQIVDLRSKMPGEWHCADEVLACELPSEKTWFDLLENKAVALSRSSFGTTDIEGRVINLSGVLMEFPPGKGIYFQTFQLYEDGHIGATNSLDKERAQELLQLCQSGLNSAWYCIEAMQTSGGLCHRVVHQPSRQVQRHHSSRGTPCHKWIEIRLGRDRNSTVSIGGISTGRTVAWHYRRGHKVNHPNPNYPKWRKGGWCGDASTGIRSHNYVVKDRI